MRAWRTVTPDRPELERRLPLEPTLLAVRFHRQATKGGPRDGEAQHRQAATAADVEQVEHLTSVVRCPVELRLGVRDAVASVEPRQQCQAVQHVPPDHLPRIAHRRQVVHAVPALEQLDETYQPLPGESIERERRAAEASQPIVEPRAKGLRSRTPALADRLAHPPPHPIVRPRARLLARPPARGLVRRRYRRQPSGQALARSSRFFRCTSSSEIAAGVTPAMRPA